MTRRKFAVIVNPRAGCGRRAQGLQRILSQIEKHDVELAVHATSRPGHATEIVAQESFAGVDAILSLGGDGTLHEVVNGLMKRQQPDAIPLGILPGGTGNAVLEHLGITQLEPAIEAVVHGAPSGVDVMQVTSGASIEYAINIVGWGAVVDINRTAEACRWMGNTRYTWAALWHVLKARRRQAKISFDDHAEEGEYYFVMACNTKFTGKGMRIAPAAGWDDGLLDVVTIRQASRWQMLQLFTRIFRGTHVEMDCVDVRQVRSLVIDSKQSDQLNIDGELKNASPCRVDVVPKAIRVLG
jgi:YegS/Rv2252/BmrU family lipid kinase